LKSSVPALSHSPTLRTPSIVGVPTSELMEFPTECEKASGSISGIAKLMLSRISVKASITVVTKESLEASWSWFSLDGEGLENKSEPAITSPSSKTGSSILESEIGCSELAKFSIPERIRVCSSIAGCSDVGCSDFSI